MGDIKPQSDIFFQIRNGARATVAMLAAMKLDLFSPLKEGPLNTEQLAEKLSVNPAKLGALLYALVVAGLLTENAGTFANTPESDVYLVKGRQDYMGDTFKIWHSNLLASLKTAETIQSGVPQSLYDWSNMPEDELRSLFEGMSANDSVFARRLSAKYDFSTCRRLLDAGGGSGGLAIAMTRIHPGLMATVVDLPAVTPITRQFVSEAAASEKVEVLTADIRSDPIPGLYDAAILSAVLQTLSADDAAAVIKNVAKALKPGGWLYIFGSGMLNNSRLSPKSAVEFNLVFINVYEHGQSYTENEHRQWLSEAGFVDINVRLDEFTIRARKKAD